MDRCDFSRKNVLLILLSVQIYSSKCQVYFPVFLIQTCHSKTLQFIFVSETSFFYRLIDRPLRDIIVGSEIRFVLIIENNFKRDNIFFIFKSYAFFYLIYLSVSLFVLNIFQRKQQQQQQQHRNKHLKHLYLEK